MNEGITAEQACKDQSLTSEDFARMCNEDGTLHSNSGTTTFTLMNDESRSITVNNNDLLLAAGGLFVLIVVGIVLFVRKRRSVSRL